MSSLRYQEFSESILGYWLVDEMNGEIYIDGQLSEQSYFCEDEGVYVFLMFFGEDNEGEFIEVTESNCGLNEVDISNPIDVIQWQYEFNDDNTMEFLKELWAFLRVRKKLWLAPIIIIMLILGGLLIIAQGSVVAPFIYTLF